MAKKKKEKAKEADAGTLERLSKAGEEAVTRLLEELGKNERVTDALSRAMSAKGRLDESARRALGQVGLAAADELKDLRAYTEKLEKRLVKLEAETKPKPAAKPRATKPRSSSSTATAKKTAEESASPAPGRAVGGGTGGGAGSGATTAT
jgi:hypothetical protein